MSKKITEFQLKMLLEQMDSISEPYGDNSSVEDDDYQERHHGLKDIDMDNGLEDIEMNNDEDLGEGYYDDVNGHTMVDRSDRHNVDDMVRHEIMGTGKIRHIFKSPEDEYLYSIKFDNGMLGKVRGHDIKECGYVPMNESVEKIKGIFKRFV